MTIKSAYAQIVERDGLLKDAEQQQIVERLNQLQIELMIRPNRWRRLFRTASNSENLKGLYLWGGVGRGKTFLMDLFFQTLDLERKKRIHFHRMMREVHDRLKRIGDTADPLDSVAAEIARDTNVLCFDEFFVSDIADAMILAKLLEGLFRRGVTLITTSNTPPDKLYHNGLQRERFLPAIDLLQRHTDVVEMDSGVDYRLELMQRAGTYLTPANSATTERLQHFFTEVAPGEAEEHRTLDILGREVQTLRCAKGVAWFDFHEICDGPRSQNDYIEIARWYQTVILSDVPALSDELADPTRRFIALVDEFYDRRVKLIISAEEPLATLYQGSKLSFEFQRTTSRLTEMQSAEYLHEPHIA